MGKVIPQGTVQRDNQPATPAQAVLSGQPGVLEQQARELREHLGRAEQTFDIDELDHVARRYARSPASGCPEALDALAVVGRFAPDCLARTEVDLNPARLEALADRFRALSLLAEALVRFTDLVKDSHMELGDEVVELLTVGWSRATALSADRLLGNERLSLAMHVLSEYQQRVSDEKAHRSAADNDPPKKPKKKG